LAGIIGSLENPWAKVDPWVFKAPYDDSNTPIIARGFDPWGFMPPLVE